ncbi:MAG: hypothetical protein OEY59_08635 [Deltaproteobacteria bacterium]|nr:hypothetical protein [Deltaproteobacteria bacterium]
MRRLYCYILILLLLLSVGCSRNNNKARVYQIQYSPSESLGDGISASYQVVPHHVEFYGFDVVAQLRYQAAHRFKETYRSPKRIYEFDGVDEIISNQGQKTSLALLVSPFDFGIYVSLGLLNLGETTSEIHYNHAQREIGENIYEGNLTVKIRRNSWKGYALGFGFQQGNDIGIPYLGPLNNFTWGLGGMWNPNQQRLSIEGADKDIKVSLTDFDRSLDPWDEAALIRQIHQYDREYPYIFFLALGFAF